MLSCNVVTLCVCINRSGYCKSIRLCFSICLFIATGDPEYMSSMVLLQD